MNNTKHLFDAMQEARIAANKVHNKGGRPPAPPQLQRVNVPLRLPAWLVAWIDAQPGTRADVIEAALLKAHKLKPPKNV